MPEFSSFDGTDLAYQQEGLGRPAVLLHGLSVNTDLNWKTPGIWGALVDVGHRVIGFDARGHGRSGKPHEPAAYEDGAMVKDVAALLDALSLDQIDLVGYSMGASTALQFAGRDRRVRRLVLGGIGGDPHAWGTPDDTRAATARRWLAGLEAADPDTIEDPLARGARKVFEARRQRPRRHGRPAARQSPASLRRNGLSRRIRADAGRLRRSGRLSPRLAAALPDAEALVIEGDHESAVGNPELAEAIVRFLAD